MEDNWISIEDRLPYVEDRILNQIRVIACWGNDEGNVAEKYFAKREIRGKEIYRWENSFGGICHQKITHWQPLPKTPKQIKQ